MLHNGFESFSTIHNEVFGPGRLCIATCNSETMISWQLYNTRLTSKNYHAKAFFWFYTGLDAINISSLLSSVIVTVCAESVGGSSEEGWVLELQENPILDLILRKGSRKSKREKCQVKKFEYENEEPTYVIVKGPEEVILKSTICLISRPGFQSEMGAQNCDFNYWKGHCWTILIILWCRIWQFLM